MASNQQLQSRLSEPVFALARSAVAARASPPRPVDQLAFVEKAYRGAIRPVLILVGIEALNVAYASYDSRLGGSQLGVQLFFGVGGAFFLLFPIFGGLRSAGWARNGLAAGADVLEAEPAVGRQKQQVVIGRRVVHHPRLGDYEDEFSLADAWREAVRRGARLEVLVAPTKRKTWMTLGVDPAH
jgi:hypothetical protein